MAIIIVAMYAAISAEPITLWADAYQLREKGLAVPQTGNYEVWVWVQGQGARSVTIAGNKVVPEGATEGWIRAGSLELRSGQADVVLGESVAAVALSTAAEFDPAKVLPDMRVYDTPRSVEDRRTERPPQTDYVFTMPKFPSQADWERRAEMLRKRILVGSGLLPIPERTALNAKIFGKVTRDDYTVEKVCFEVRPGFYCTGNLYRPIGNGPFPAVASPHGHWDHGRLEDSDVASVPGRCITLARMGAVAFSYDMIGSQDSLQFPHNWGGKRERLWGIHPFAFHLWTSIRVLDFLAGLPEVDASRLGVTGASGGGTQTFAVASVDPRVKVAAPANMISRHMQGGCLCENAPLLRLDNSSIEIGALMAPRPLLMISATGDWTDETPREEFPAIRSIYELYGVPERVENHHFDFPHNYNKDGRTAMYRFFGKWLLGDEAKWKQFTEPPFEVETRDELRVFPDGKLPEGTPSKDEVIASTIRANRRKWEAILPSSSAELDSFRSEYAEALRVALNAESPHTNEIDPERTGRIVRENHILERWVLHRPAKGDAIPALAYLPKDRFPADAVLVVHGNGKAALADLVHGGPGPLISALLAQNKLVVAIDAYLTGEHHSPFARTKREGLVRHFTDPKSWLNLGDYWVDDAFVPTESAFRVQDILTAAMWLRNRRDATGIIDLIGLDDAGIWCLFASALDKDIRKTWVDANQFDTEDDDGWADRFYVPAIRSIGDITTASAMIAPRPLWIANTGERFVVDGARRMYRAAGADTLTVIKEAVGVSQITSAMK